MGFKWTTFETKTLFYMCTATLGVPTTMSYKIYISYLILVPFLLIFWTYVICIIKNNMVTTNNSSTIEVNIIHHEERNNLSAEKLVKKIKYHVPKFMLELYEKNKSARKGEDDADLVRSLIPTQAEKLEENDILEEFAENHLLIFNIPSSAKDEEFIGAELKILTQIHIRSTEEYGVKKSLKLSIFDEVSEQYVSHRELHIHHFNDTWISFNLTEEVANLLRSDSKLLKVMVTVSAVYHQSKNDLTLSILPSVVENYFDHDYPILILSYTITENDKKRVIRNRRSVDDDDDEDANQQWSSHQQKSLKKYKRNSCKRRPLYINFSEINYDLFIVQPTGYEAYQCHGRCFYPVAEHLNPTQHAIMQALLHSVDPAKAPRSCCVPTRLDSISILYVDSRGVLTYRYAYKDMVVIECGCR